MRCAEDVVRRLDLADDVEHARVAVLLDRGRRQPELRGDRLDVPPHAKDVLPGRHVLERDGHEDVAHALEAGAAHLEVRVLLGDQRALELPAALALEAQQRREIFGVARGLPLEEGELAELRFEVLGEPLLARVHRGEVLCHPQRLRARLLRDTDRLLQELAEDLRGLRFDVVLGKGRAELDELDVPAESGVERGRPLGLHDAAYEAGARIVRIVSMSSSGPNGFVRYCAAPAANPTARSLSLSCAVSITIRMFFVSSEALSPPQPPHPFGPGPMSTSRSMRSGFSARASSRAFWPFSASRIVQPWVDRVMRTIWRIGTRSSAMSSFAIAYAPFCRSPVGTDATAMPERMTEL